VLEGETKAKLLDRSPAGVTPTSAGAILYRRALLILRQIADLESDVREADGEVAGGVALGLTPTIALAVGVDLMRTLAIRHPNIRLHISEGGSTALDARIIRGELDVALTPVRIAADGIETRPIAEEALYVAASSEMAALEPGASMAAFVELPWIVTSPPNSIRSLFDAAFAEAGCRPSIAAEVDSLPLVVRAVEEGLGVSLLPRAVVDQSVRQSRVRLTALGGRVLRRTLYLSRRTAPFASPAATVVADILDEIAKALQLDSE
jgi:DNA-binding transcriptional LysR family regulator